MAQTRVQTRAEGAAIAGRLRRVRVRANLALVDFTDCLLQAYDGVARRAYQKFVARGSKPGSELDDWLSSERELATHIQVDVAESENFVHAMVTLKGDRGGEVSVALEGRWLMVLDAQEFVCQGAPQAVLSTMDWNSEMGAAVAATELTRGFGVATPNRVAGGCDVGAETEEADERESMRVRWGSQPFCVVELPSEVDRERSVCVLADGVLAVRMPKSGK
jgi:Protein of unknown function (DUF2934)